MGSANTARRREVLVRARGPGSGGERDPFAEGGPGVAELGSQRAPKPLDGGVGGGGAPGNLTEGSEGAGPAGRRAASPGWARS